MSIWLINGASPESYGVVVAGGQFASGSVSTVRLERVSDFDAAEAFAYNTEVTITCDGAPFFRGKVRAIPKHADGAAEGQTYLVEDAWADLERVTYQEAWGSRQNDYTGTAYSPTVILGMKADGTRINVGQQIAEVLAFAATAGVSVTAGSMPTGMDLWPSEVTGMSCAEVIRDCLKYYPDWIPWLDHSTSPPTFQVTPRSAATARDLAVTDCAKFDVSKTHDRVPAGVRIVYLTASTYDDEIFRSMSIDQYPAVSVGELVAPAGVGILCTTVNLAGAEVQIQKQQVQTRTLPTTSAGAKDYLRIKFPALKDLSDADFSVTEWTTAVIPEVDEEVDPIDVKLVRLPGNVRSDLPRELVRGNIAEWMRKKEGRVLIEFKAVASGTATAEERKKIEALPPNFTVIATNAVTKIYKGISSYNAPEDIPTGIAASFYQTLVNGCYFAGSTTVVETDVGATRWHGSKLNLTGGVSEWASMGAPIHTVNWDLNTCETTLNFGPNPDFSAQDFVEFLRLLNKRHYTQYSIEERNGNKHGAQNKVSARGDTVGGFITPETIYGGGAGEGEATLPLTLKKGTATDKIQVIPGYVNAQMPKRSGVELNAGTPPEITITSDTWIWLKVIGTFGTPDTYVVTVETSSTATAPAVDAITATTFTTYLLIGWVTADYTITNNSAGGNLGVESFGYVNLWWRQ